MIENSIELDRLMTLFQGPAKLSNAEDQTLLRTDVYEKGLTDIDS